MNFLIDPFIFNAPFDNTTIIILIKSLKDELKGLILSTNIFTEDVIVRSLFTYDTSPVFDGLIVMPVITMMQLGFMHSIINVLNMMELLCEEVEPLCSSCMYPKFNADFTTCK
ncbi:hypothetical protein CR513_60430, partial [Mucuna pruriens]